MYFFRNAFPIRTSGSGGDHLKLKPIISNLLKFCNQNMMLPVKLQPARELLNGSGGTEKIYGCRREDCAVNLVEAP